jgi:hypothetical protein
LTVTQMNTACKVIARWRAVGSYEQEVNLGKGCV